MLKKITTKCSIVLLALQTHCFGAFYSQCGQDAFVYENYFKNYTNGVFVDIGAHSGVVISNSYFFEKELNWSGICIEPIPELFRELKMNRNCICVEGCISDAIGTKQFVRFPEGVDWFSGLKDKFEPGRLEVLYAHGLTSYEVIDVNCYLLNDILAENKISHINFLSIDTEGGELDILKTIDFSKFTIDVIAVEDNYNDINLSNFLVGKGFRLTKRLDQDLIFVRRGFIP